MTEHLDPKYDSHSQESRRHRSRRSSSIPSALWMILGALVALLIVLAVRGPSTVVVQSNGNNCGCCCERAPCNPLREPETPIRGDRIGQTPTAPPVPPPVGPGPSSPCCDDTRVANRTTTTPIIPFWPWWDNGGGGGSDDGGGGTNGGGNPGTGPTPVPEPGTLALLIAGVAGLRFLA